MKYTKDEKIAMTKTNAQLFELADIITDNGYDVYSYVASKIFNKPYEECLEQIDYNWNPTGKIMRDIAKYICIRGGVDDISNTYKIPNLKQLVVDAFPFRFSDDIDDDDISDDLDDRCCESVTFLMALTGYVRFTKFYERNNKTLEKLTHTDD